MSFAAKIIKTRPPFTMHHIMGLFFGGRFRQFRNSQEFHSLMTRIDADLLKLYELEEQRFIIVDESNPQVITLVAVGQRIPGAEMTFMMFIPQD